LTIRRLISSIALLAAGLLAGLGWSSHATPGSEIASHWAVSAEQSAAPVRPKSDSDPRDLPPPRSTIGINGSIAFVINDVRSGSAADQAGLQRGDVIHSVGRKQFNSMAEFWPWTQVEPGTQVMFTILRRTQSGVRVYDVSIPTAKP